MTVLTNMAQHDPRPTVRRGAMAALIELRAAWELVARHSTDPGKVREIAQEQLDAIDGARSASDNPSEKGGDNA